METEKTNNELKDQLEEQADQYREVSEAEVKTVTKQDAEEDEEDEILQPRRRLKKRSAATAATEEKDKPDSIMDEAEPEETGERRPRRLRRGGSKKEAVQKVIESGGDNSDVEVADNDESNYDPSHDNKKKSKHDKVKASRKLVLTRKTRKAKDVDEDEQHESLKDEQVADDGSII